MKRLWSALALAILSGLILVGCTGQGGSSSATAPAQVLACQANNTATVSFQNQSRSNYTHTIVWDGSDIVNVTPGSTSQTFTVAAGITHTLRFKIANTNNLACNDSTPTLAQCSSQVFSCTG